MGRVLEPIPTPPFAVYGLAASYTGPRWISVWNRLWTPDGPLWMVELGHGEFASSRWVGVVTDGKLAAHRTEYGFVGPTGVDDARRMACLEMVTMATPADERASIEFRQAVDLAGGAGEGFAVSGGVLNLDGVSVEVAVQTYRDAWMACVDLGEVAVAVFGAEPRLHDVSVQTVNNRLADYQTLPSG